MRWVLCCSGRCYDYSGRLHPDGFCDLSRFPWVASPGAQCPPRGDSVLYSQGQVWCQYVLLNTRRAKRFFSSSQVKVGRFNMPGLWVPVHFGSLGTMSQDACITSDLNLCGDQDRTQSRNFWMKGTWLQHLAPPLLAVGTFPDFLTPVGFRLLGNMGVALPLPSGCFED